VTRLSHESFSREQRAVVVVISVMANRFRGLDDNVVDERAFAWRLNRFMQQPLTFRYRVVRSAPPDEVTDLTGTSPPRCWPSLFDDDRRPSFEAGCSPPTIKDDGIGAAQ
jgi:hypothetical protein